MNLYNWLKGQFEGDWYNYSVSNSSGSSDSDTFKNSNDIGLEIQEMMKISNYIDDFWTNQEQLKKNYEKIKRMYSGTYPFRPLQVGLINNDSDNIPYFLNFLMENAKGDPLAPESEQDKLSQSLISLKRVINKAEKSLSTCKTKHYDINVPWDRITRSTICAIMIGLVCFGAVRSFVSLESWKTHFICSIIETVIYTMTLGFFMFVGFKKTNYLFKRCAIMFLVTLVLALALLAYRIILIMHRYYHHKNHSDDSESVSLKIDQHASWLLALAIAVLLACF